MLLFIDAGNTRIKWALVDPAKPQQLGQWQQVGAMTHQELSQSALPWSGIPLTRVLVSNVAGPWLAEQLQLALADVQVPIDWFLAQAACAGIRNHYQEPTKLGSDRFASAIGAHALFPQQNLLVVTCGTATTLDAVNMDGDFIGGMITPGLQLMAQSLTQNTAQLPTAPLPTVAAQKTTPMPFATYTEAAMVSGCIVAQVGAIEHALRSFATMLDSAVLPLCVLSGGAAPYIAPHLSVPYQSIDNLVLIGLQVSTC